MDQVGKAKFLKALEVNLQVFLVYHKVSLGTLILFYRNLLLVSYLKGLKEKLHIHEKLMTCQQLRKK